MYNFHTVADRPTPAVHHTITRCTEDNVLKGSAQLTLGDVSGDAEAQDWFSPKSVNPEREGALLSLSQKSGHQRQRVQW